MKKRLRLHLYFASSLFIVFILLWSACTNYGFLQAKEIDDRDLERWDYEQDMIKGAGPITLQGNNATCWLMYHGYTSTPLEMKELAERVHKEFNDTVLAPVLSGHSAVPSELKGKNAKIWYEEVKKKFQNLKSTCDTVNVVGSSFSAMLMVKLAAEKDLNRVYLINPFFFGDGAVLNLQIKYFSGIMHYKKKILPGINNPEMAKKHVSYMNMPLMPIKDSLMFSKTTLLDANKIDEPLLIQHSKNDKTANPESSELIYAKATTSDKELVWYEKSNHILLQDYDREAVIQKIIDFEKERK